MEMPGTDGPLEKLLNIALYPLALAPKLAVYWLQFSAPLKYVIAVFVVYWHVPFVAVRVTVKLPEFA
jgi:hypothetical protein